MRKVLLSILGAVVLLAGVGWIFRVEFVLAGMKFLTSRQEVGPNQQITWSSGPDPEGRPASERPPNIVLILADDLGWNDLTIGGGGVAGGTVPTPAIDSIGQQGVTFTNGYAANGTWRAVARGADVRPLRHALRLRVHADTGRHDPDRRHDQ